MWQMRADGLTADSGPSSSRTSGVRDGVFTHSPWRLSCSWTSLLSSSCCAETLRVCLPDAEVTTRSRKQRSPTVHWLKILASWLCSTAYTARPSDGRRAVLWQSCLPTDLIEVDLSHLGLVVVGAVGLGRASSQ